MKQTIEKYQFAITVGTALAVAIFIAGAAYAIGGYKKDIEHRLNRHDELIVQNTAFREAAAIQLAEIQAYVIAIKERLDREAKND